MRQCFALFCLVFFASPSSVRAQDLNAPPLPLRVLDAATTAPVPSAEIHLPSGALITLGDGQGFASIPAHAADSAFLVVRADGYDVDTLFPPFGEEILLSRRGSRTIEEVVVRPDAATPVTPSRRDAVIDYTFAGDYLLVATSRAPRKNALLLLDPRGDTVAHTTMREEPSGLFSACDGAPYVIFSHLNRFQPVFSEAARLQLGNRYPMRVLSTVQACQLQFGDALYYKSFSPESFKLSLWRWGVSDSTPRLIAERSDDDAARSSWEMDWQLASNARLWQHYSYSLEAIGLQILRNRLAQRELDGKLMLLHDTLLLPDYRSRSLLHYTPDGKELQAVPFRFSWGKLVQFSLLQDAATGRIYLHRDARPHAQTIQELDPRTGALVGREVRLEKSFAEKVAIRRGRIYYLWQDDQAAAAKQLFTQSLPKSR